MSTLSAFEDVVHHLFWVWRDDKIMKYYILRQCQGFDACNCLKYNYIGDAMVTSEELPRWLPRPSLQNGAADPPLPKYRHPHEFLHTPEEEL